LGLDVGGVDRPSTNASDGAKSGFGAGGTRGEIDAGMGGRTTTSLGDARSAVDVGSSTSPGDARLDAGGRTGADGPTDAASDRLREGAADARGGDPADARDADGAPAEAGDGAPNPPPCSADFHALPISEFQTCSAYWTARGFRPQTVSISPDGRRITGSFQSGKTSDAQFRYDMTASEFDELRESAKATNLAVKDFSIYRISIDEKRYAAIFEHSGGLDVHTVREVTDPEFNTTWTDLFYAGFTQTDGFIHSYDGPELSFSGAWVKRETFSDYPARFCADPFRYADENLLFVPRFRINHCQGFLGPDGSIDYFAVWEPSEENRFVSFSESESEYAANYARIKGYGYTLRKVNMPDADSYTAIWVGPHDICEPGAKLLAESDPCAVTVCMTEPRCCSEAWSSSCVYRAQTLCARCL
jgi:hypothetical protein